MRPVFGPMATLCAALAFLALSCDIAAAQLSDGSALGQYYSVVPPTTVQPTFDAIRIERLAPPSLVTPPPIGPLPLGVRLSALTGAIIELPERGQLFFTAFDAAGALRLFQVDLLRREVRTVVPPAGTGAPYAIQMLEAPDGSKLYVQWLAYGPNAPTDIYDGSTLRWLGHSLDFRPDLRAAGFEGRRPYMWTLDAAGRPVLVDTQRDVVAAVFDYRRWFGPLPGVIADAWRDLLLVRLDVGHDRFQVVDVASGEIGPPLDLDGYQQAQPRLVLDGRMMVLIDMERRSARGRRRRAETAIAPGGGSILDLRNGIPMGQFHLVVPFDLPVSAVGTTSDPGLPGRLWIHVPGDNERFDFDLPGCGRKVEGVKGLEAALGARWDPGDGGGMYRYRVKVAVTSQTAAGAVAVEAGRQTHRTAVPGGWGVDLIKRDSWVRWTNGLGPVEEDVAPGESLSGFAIEAAEGTRPGIGDYRIQAALGLPRGCESDGRFLKNSLSGPTLVPVKVDTIDPLKLARRLQSLLDRACAAGWVAPADCSALQAAASGVESSRADRKAALDRFLQVLAAVSLRNEARIVLADAAAAIDAVLEPGP